MYETRTYEGIPELLGELTDRGTRLAVATSKPEEMAVPIVEAMHLSGFFETVCGDTLAGERSSKALVITEALRRLGDPDPAGVLMIGDRSHDVIGAREHGIPCLGAGWGYGLPGELEEAGARAVYPDATSLRQALLGR